MKTNELFYLKLPTCLRFKMCIRTFWFSTFLTDTCISVFLRSSNIKEKKKEVVKEPVEKTISLYGHLYSLIVRVGKVHNALEARP